MSDPFDFWPYVALECRFWRDYCQMKEYTIADVVLMPKTKRKFLLANDVLKKITMCCIQMGINGLPPRSLKVGR